jgi:hypothetical protein
LVRSKTFTKPFLAFKISLKAKRTWTLLARDAWAHCSWAFLATLTPWSISSGEAKSTFAVTLPVAGL